MTRRPMNPSARKRARDRAANVLASLVLLAIAATFGGLGVALALQPVDPYGAPVAVQAAAAALACGVGTLAAIGAAVCAWGARP